MRYSIQRRAAPLEEQRAPSDDLSMRRLGAALDAVTIGVIVSDEHGDELYRNPVADKLIGGRLGEVLVDEAVSDLLERACRGEAGERTLDLFAPVRRGLSIQATPLGDARRPLGAVAVIEDVSERQRTDAIRRDFVANVTHELKTPIGALSLLAETLDGEEDADVVARLAARIGAEAQRLGQLVDNLLDLGRIEAETEEAPEVAALADLVREAIEPLQPKAASKGIALDVIDPSDGVAVACVARDLTSAVANLVDNAIKYSDAGSAIRVEAGADGPWAYVEVTDQGIGIPARDLERIFERFYRVDRARSRSTGGTGLGLSLVRHVAANHGGTISVTSIEGEGSTFTLRIPRPGGEKAWADDG